MAVTQPIETTTSQRVGTVGLVGLGAMGRGVAANLERDGFQVFGCDVRPESRSALGRDARFTTQPAELGPACDIIVSFVVNDAQTEELLFGAEGAAAAMRRDSIFVMCSTVPPAYARDLGPRLAERGIVLIDSPVTGGAAGAAKGSLTIMASGPKDAFLRVRPVLESFGARIYHLGEENGAGSQMKVINQLLCGVHLAAAGEALAMAKRQGLPLETVHEILCSGSASSWMLGDRGPRMVKADWDTITSAVDIFVKDTNLVLDAARETGCAVPLTQVANHAFRTVSAGGLGRKDDSAVMRFFEGQEEETR